MAEPCTLASECTTWSALQVVNGPELLSELAGDSEAAVHALFATARAVAPSVIFLDEIDALAPARSGMAAPGARAQGSEAASRVLSILLMEMDSLAESDVAERCASATGPARTCTMMQHALAFLI
jgi:SpoVK/Ycf46/Vps4 family AAA+-type ATPase